MKSLFSIIGGIIGAFGLYYWYVAQGLTGFNAAISACCMGFAGIFIAIVIGAVKDRHDRY